MTQVTTFSSPYLLGFDQLEAVLDRVTKAAGDSFPPYNIERFEPGETDERFRVTLAVAGIRAEDLDVTVEATTLTISGGRTDDSERDYLHRGIAARRFVREFVLAEGMEVTGAVVENGLLSVDLVRPLAEARVKRIPIVDRG